MAIPYLNGKTISLFRNLISKMVGFTNESGGSLENQPFREDPLGSHKPNIQLNLEKSRDKPGFRAWTSSAV